MLSVTPERQTMGWNPFRRKWAPMKARVTRAEPLHNNHESAIVPYRAAFEIHPDDGGAPFVIERKVTVGRDKPFGANLWVAVRVAPDRKNLELDWKRTQEVQMQSGDTASKLMAAVMSGVTDPEALQDLVGAQPTAPAASPDIAAQLQKVSELHRVGALDDDEFEAAKKRILGGS